MVAVVYGRVSHSINLTNLWISIDPTNWTTQLLDVHPHYKVFIDHFNKPVQHMYIYIGNIVYIYMIYSIYIYRLYIGYII